MKNTLFLVIMTMSFYSLSQYPSWFPDDLKNKVFCGEISFVYEGGRTSKFFKVPYKLHVSEDGFFVEINAEELGLESGQTMKLKYRVKKVIPNMTIPSMRKKYILDVSPKSETNDSPLHPKYDLKSISITADNYDPKKVKLTREQERVDPFLNKRKSWGTSNIAFEVEISYYGIHSPTARGGGPVTLENTRVCKKLKTRKQIAEEKRQSAIRDKKIKSLCAEINPLIEKDILAAASKFDSNNDLLLSSDLATSTLNNLKSALREYYENKSINIDDKITESVIEKNKTLLALLVNGNYEVGVNNYKNITKPEAFEGFKVDIPPSLIEGACCGVQKPYNFNIERTSKDSILVSTKYYSSSKKPIYRKDEKTFYFKTKTGLSSIDFIFDASMPKGEIKIFKQYKTVKYANDNIIEEKTYSDIKKRGIIKKE